MFKSKNTPLKIFFLILLFAGLYIFALKKPQPQNEAPSSKASLQSNQTISINALEFDRLAQDPKTFVLDVHIPEQTHIPGTDAFIPYDQLADNIDRLPQDKNTPILVYCRSGSMSGQAAQELKQLGYSQVYDLEGGIIAYKESHIIVSITPATQDLGTVVYGDITKTNFILTNFTNNNVNITKISTSCGCTSAKSNKESLSPYESATITVSFDPAVHKDNTDLGELTRTIYINTDQPNFKQILATITANVIKK